ncbi:MAG: hypothetical protein AAGE61_01885 [Pseudomonadota bacterium]
MHWKSTSISLLCALVMYYMAQFTEAHLKDGGMVWWGGWIAVTLFVIAAFILMQQLKKARYPSVALQNFTVALRYTILILTALFVWEALARGIPLPPDIIPAPSQLFK